MEFTLLNILLVLSCVFVAIFGVKDFIVHLYNILFNKIKMNKDISLEIKQKVIIFIVGILLLILSYPYIIDCFIGFYKHNKQTIKLEYHHNRVLKSKTIEEDLTAERGTFGDMYGLLNTIFSGIALLGVVYTLYFEKLNKRKEELQTQRDKLGYLHSVSTIILSSGNRTSIKIKEVIDIDIKNIIKYYPESLNHIDSTVGRMKNIINKFDEETYFFAYVQNISQEKSYDERSIEFNRILGNLHSIYQLTNEIYTIVIDSNNNITTNKNEISEILVKCLTNSQGDIDRNFHEVYAPWYYGKKSLLDLIVLKNSLYLLIESQINNQAFQISQPVSMLIINKERVNLIEKQIQITISNSCVNLEILIKKLNPIIEELTNDIRSLEDFLNN